MRRKFHKYSIVFNVIYDGKVEEREIEIIKKSYFQVKIELIGVKEEIETIQSNMKKEKNGSISKRMILYGV